MGTPMIVALNMSDAAQRRGIAIDRAALERELGVPVVETVAVRHHGARALVEGIDVLAAHPRPPAVRLAEGADLHAETRRLRYVMQLEHHDDIAALFQMTPYYWKTSAKGAKKLEGLEKLAIEAAFDIHIYKKEN